MPVDRDTIAIAMAALVLGSALGVVGVSVTAPTAEDPGPDGPAGPPDGTDAGDGADSATAGVERFASEAAFREYVQRDSGRVAYAAVGAAAGGEDAMRSREVEDAPQATPAPSRTVAETAADAGGDAGGGDGGDAPDRVSGTNVQERGIDEPDVLKTDGRTVFYAPRPARYHHPERRGGLDTEVVDVSTPADPARLGEIEASGRMLLAGDSLVVFGDDRIVGYDVADPENPDRTWETELDGRLTAARLYDGSIYLVVAQGVDPEDPCPVAPLGEGGPSVACDEVYRPTKPAAADVTYTTMRVDPADGDVADTVSVVGSREVAATYVSENGVYLSYVRRASRAELSLEFLLTNRSDRLDEPARERLRELRSYDLSDRALQVEIRATVRAWLGRVDADRRDELRRELAEAFEAYLAAHKRELTTTGIVKVGIGDDLAVEAVGEVPGVPLNQFSLDERDGQLRVATTVSPRRGGSESANDLYVLDDSLSVVGSVKGMAEGQRIYAARYVGDTAYLVTFRRVDPFHVIDLSDPENPEELGQVKLPGFSQYLHPLGDDRVLGIGREDGQVKAVVFDVSTPTDPVVRDSKLVDDRWSAIARTHHAFLHDPKHGVFFLPGSEGGYVFSYEDGLAVEKRIRTEGAARRAMYLDDYLYVFGTEELVVVDETTWERVDTLAFEGPTEDEE